MNTKITRLPFFQNFANLIVLAVIAMVCAFPILHTLALSLSSASAASSGRVTLWPVEFTTQSYTFVLENPAFLRSFGVSLLRVLVGVPVNMILTILVAYPLSRSTKDFRPRDYFAWFFLIPALFSGGLIPWYMIIRQTGLIDSFWEEAAAMDGAGHWTILFKILLPMSMPILATLTLFVAVAHWNSWFDGIILMNTPANYPLQSYLQTVVINPDPRFLSERDLALLQLISNRTTRAAEIFIAMIPIMVIYPFLQRYFVTGIKLGSVKG
jgi:putative aldouronate transport system permease protein